ncbi:hypothetical protein LMH87_012117 [Akanthomyces muscarius]|uniref:Uncharacterized protein n=1 Tax=Akanthomyces muscarius TaxID=2231603 RepID=A0A9W8ULQ5_AKAMU|nr:hypothetical protein LMH87_012117 [Akanthomyces muscarius]KAJ4151416.1 hypothetical protein LMH87_012117 [Akanthomyces muscarius]
MPPRSSSKARQRTGRESRRHVTFSLAFHLHSDQTLDVEAQIQATSGIPLLLHQTLLPPNKMRCHPW